MQYIKRLHDQPGRFTDDALRDLFQTAKRLNEEDEGAS